MHWPTCVPPQCSVQSWGYELALIDGTGIEQRLPNLLAEIRAVDELKGLNILVSVRLETLAHKLKRDYGVLVLADALRPEPLRRMLHRLFDVESQHFGNAEMQPEEIYDDLNVSATMSPWTSRMLPTARRICTARAAGRGQPGEPGRGAARSCPSWVCVARPRPTAARR